MAVPFVRCLVFLFLSFTTAWLVPTRIQRRRSPRHSSSSKRWDAAVDPDVQRARAILEKSKAKLAARESIAAAAAVPFFAQKAPISRASVVKAVHPITGLIRADGAKLAEISESEAWELKSLGQVFDNEMTEEEDRYSLASQQLAARDVAESIFQLRKELQTEDYRTIFDTNNRFIGEDN